jgi:cell division inhibitor SepF
MGVLNKFLSAMNMHSEDEFDDDDFLDDEIDEEYEEERQPKKRFFKRPEENLDDYEEEAPRSTRAKAQRQPKTSAATSATSGSSKISPMRPKKSNGMEVCVIKPHSLEDAREITETLLSNCTIILNMEGLDVDVAQRIIDFASGSCYAVDGNLQKISGFIFVLTPVTVPVSGDFQQILNGAFDATAMNTNY